jgi:DNA primase catalytic core
MLSDKTIQQVRDLSITEVISHYIKLDKKGSACCPFHNEKSPSFKVTEAKGIFKCFGCGVAGDHIAFVMRNDKLAFIEAIIHIAGLCHVDIEYDESIDKEDYQKQKAVKDVMHEVLDFTIADYKDNLWNLPPDHPVSVYLTGRGITKEIIAEWQIGWSTEEWQHLSTSIINKNWYTPANQLGIVLTSKADTRNYDGYRSRITFPITNKHGQYIGLAGRFFEIDPADADKKFPKYINPPQNELYDKSQVLYGLSKAIKAIEAASCAYLVEGYTDVISMHTNGKENTVATCGTALTSSQASLLKRYTSHAIIMRDGDAAGLKAAIRDLQTLLKEGFKCDIIILPEGEDPDSYIQKDKELSEVKQQDAIFWYITHLLVDASDDHFKIGKIKEDVLQLLLLIPNEIIRNQYFDGIVKKWKWQKADLQKQLNSLIDQRAEVVDDGEGRAINNIPKWMNKEHFEMHGYSAVNNGVRTGYYTHNGDKSIEVTNFIITPIFHVYAGKDSRLLILIDNGKRTAVLDIEAKALVSLDLLQAHVVAEGNFIIHGSKPQILRIASQLLESFQKCVEIKFLGWHNAGFFAFSDKIYVPGQGLIELDKWGVYKHSDERNYLVPAASAAYAELQQAGDDQYEHDRVLQYRKSSITFSQWASLMQRVYADKGIVAVAYTILTVFRDIVFDIDNNCPHLYGYGERSSGKSKWAESISAVFYKKRSAFPLNSGTDYSFFSYMQRFINCPSFLNEFDKEIIRPEWFQAIKGVFDGEGRQKGVMGSQNKIQVMKVRSTLLLMGQYLNTSDDNSIVSRSIIQDFHEVDRNDDDKKEFDKLKALEEEGLSHLLVEILQHRLFVKENYRTVFNELLGEWRRSITDTTTFNQRIMQNWCHLYTCWLMLSDKIKLPISNDQFEAYCKKQGLRWSKFIRQSDTLSQFWEMLSFLVDQRMVIEGWDFKIKEENSVKVRKGKEDFTEHFNQPTKILYLRLNNVHKLYEKEYKIRTNQPGMSIENLKHYFSGRKYFIGNNASGRFSRFVYRDEKVSTQLLPGSLPVSRIEGAKHEEAQISSSYMFIYDELGVDIERINEAMDGPVLDSQNSGNVEQSQELPF